jgi:hypothetical protein
MSTNAGAPSRTTHQPDTPATAKAITATPKPEFVEFRYETLRNISTKLDEKNTRKLVSGQAPLESVIGLSIEKNVRKSLFDAEGKKRKILSAVHRAIKRTLETRPEDFNVLNGGVKVCASRIETDEAKKIARLYDASIMNGAQTQSVIQLWLEECEKAETPISEAYIPFTILVTADENLVTEVAISSNFQNHVEDISIAGRRGKLDELEAAAQAHHPELKLRKSETDFAEENTKRLLQVITALIPAELWPSSTPGEAPNKTFTYSQQSKCLNEFCRVYDAAKDTTAPNHSECKALYQFYLDIAPQAYELYKKWKSHQGFKGTALKALKRDKVGNILEVPDGIIFPVLASLSAFAVKTRDGWRIHQPASYKDADIIIKRVKPAYMGWASSNPQTMGKSRACYDHLYDIAKIYKELT